MTGDSPPGGEGPLQAGVGKFEESALSVLDCWNQALKL